MTCCRRGQVLIELLIVLATALTIFYFLVEVGRTSLKAARKIRASEPPQTERTYYERD